MSANLQINGLPERYEVKREFFRIAAERQRESDPCFHQLYQLHAKGEV